MEVKLIELRDRATFIPAIAIRLSHADGYLARRAGYASPCVLFGHMNGGREFQHDPFDWHDRTYQIAHRWIAENWEAIPNEGVVDVEFILGETPAPKVSEREWGG